jgi:hypothetical protein
MGLREVDDAVIAALLAEVRNSREHFDSGTELLRVASGQIAIVKEDVVRLLSALEHKASVVELKDVRNAVDKIAENCKRIQEEKQEETKAELEALNTHHKGLWALIAAIIAAAVTGLFEIFKHWAGWHS